MSYQAAVRAIIARIDELWAPTGFPISYPNLAFAIPTSGTWARVTIEHTAGAQRTISQPDQLYTQLGTVIVQVFVESGRGLAIAANSDPIQLIQKAFRGVQLAGGVFFMRVSPKEVGRDGPWFQTNVSAVFQYDERT
jgi:uncharacterized protein DUF4128